MVYNRNIEIQQQGYDKLAEDATEILNDTLKKIDADQKVRDETIANTLDLLKDNESASSEAIQGILSDTGIKLGNDAQSKIDGFTDAATLIASVVDKEWGENVSTEASGIDTSKIALLSKTVMGIENSIGDDLADSLSNAIPGKDTVETELKGIAKALKDFKASYEASEAQKAREEELAKKAGEDNKLAEDKKKDDEAKTNGGNGGKDSNGGNNSSVISHWSDIMFKLQDIAKETGEYFAYDSNKNMVKTSKGYLNMDQALEYIDNYPKMKDMMEKMKEQDILNKQKLEEQKKLEQQIAKTGKATTGAATVKTTANTSVATTASSLASAIEAAKAAVSGSTSAKTSTTTSAKTDTSTKKPTKSQVKSVVENTTKSKDKSGKIKKMTADEKKKYANDKSHSALGKLIVDKFSLLPGDYTFAQIAMLFGIKTASGKNMTSTTKVTNDKTKEEIRKALKGIGYRKGSKSTEDELNWLHNKEVIVRKSDGAILQPFNSGDMVFTSKQSENLWKMSQVDPNIIKKMVANPDMSKFIQPGITNVQKAENNNQTIHIDSLITINGNADQQTVADIKQIAEELVKNRDFKKNVTNFVTKDMSREASKAGYRGR